MRQAPIDEEASGAIDAAAPANIAPACTNPAGGDAELLQTPPPRWYAAEEAYLRDLSELCQTLSVTYKENYELYKTRDARFKIPSIVISSFTGLISFGSSNFPAEYVPYVSIAAGISSMLIALLSGIDAYMKTGPIMSGCIAASLHLQKLKETIDMELSLLPTDRSEAGIQFTRECYTRYERIIETSPSITNTVAFVRTSLERAKREPSPLVIVESVSTAIERDADRTGPSRVTMGNRLVEMVVGRAARRGRDVAGAACAHKPATR